MRYSLILLVAAAVSLATTFAAAQTAPEQPTAPPKAASPPETIATPPAEINVPTGPTPPGDGRSADPKNAWRFVWHNRLWWYWLPTETWVYSYSGAWVPYDPDTYKKHLAERAQREPLVPSWRHWGPAYYSNSWAGGRVGVSVGPFGVRVRAPFVRVGVDY